MEPNTSISQTSTRTDPSDQDHSSSCQRLCQSSIAQCVENDGTRCGSSDEEDGLFWMQAAEVLSQQELTDTPNSWDVEEELEASVLFQELLAEKSLSF